MANENMGFWTSSRALYIGLGIVVAIAMVLLFVPGARAQTSGVGLEHGFHSISPGQTIVLRGNQGMTTNQQTRYNWQLYQQLPGERVYELRSVSGVNTITVECKGLPATGQQGGFDPAGRLLDFRITP